MKLDKSDYEKNIKEAKKEGQDFADDTEQNVSPKVAAAWAAIAAAVVKVIQKVYQLARESMNYADTIGDLAAQYGVTTDAISEMQFIADQSSTSIEGLTSAMTMLYNRAKEDGEAFQELGISVKETSGDFKSMDELFYETVGALNSIENEGERSAYMLDFFGRSAMTVGEVLRKSSDELARMRQDAHDLGVVLDTETIQYASDFNDTIARLKLQGQSALASLVAGAPDAEERLRNFFDNVMDMLEGYAPTFVNFFVRLLTQTAIALVKIAPSLAVDIVLAIEDTILNIDWVEFGVNIGKKILEGIVNVAIMPLKGILKLFGVDIPKFNFGGEDQNFMAEENLGNNYEISKSIKQDINVKVEASGDSEVSKETAEKTAEALAPYIDKILGGK